MSVTEDDGEPTSLGSQVAPHLQRLPIGEPNALMRLHQVAYATQAHKDTGRAVGARSLADIAGFAPTTLHALGVRVSTEVMRKQHDMLITNVPGPQVPLYAAGAGLVASYPVLPLSAGHLLTIGVTSYDGEVFFGLTADRDAISDLDVLAQCLLDALEELLDTTVRATDVRQPTRKAPAAARRAAAKKAAARQEAARKAAAQKRAAVRNLVSAPPSWAPVPPRLRPRPRPGEADEPRKRAAQKARGSRSPPPSREAQLPSRVPAPEPPVRHASRAAEAVDVRHMVFRSDDLGRGGRLCDRVRRRTALGVRGDAEPGCSMEADSAHRGGRVRRAQLRRRAGAGARIQARPVGGGSRGAAESADRSGRAAGRGRGPRSDAGLRCGRCSPTNRRPAEATRLASEVVAGQSLAAALGDA